MLRTVEEALQFVEENDVKFIRLTFCDVFGVQKNISIMPGELAQAFKDGVPFEASAVQGFMSNESAELLLFPDPNTLAFLPWRPATGRVVRVFCNICYPDGKPFLGDGRFMLKQAIKRLRAADLECKLGTECEFYLLELNEDGTISRRPNDRAGYLDVAPLDKGEDVRRQICLYLEEMGIQPKTSHHERGPGQNEIDFSASAPMTAADDFLSFKTVVKTVANYNGLYASMLPKPFEGQYGCGLHTHFFLYRGGQNIFGANSPEPETAKHFIAGILNHICEITLFLNSLTNSYARFGSFEAPAYISWSDTSRFQLISFPISNANSVHMELRSPDSCLNPYLAFALLLNAGLEGVEQKLPLAEPLQSDEVPTDDGQFARLPRNLGEAIAAAEGSDFVKSVITEEIQELFISAKREEWQQYVSAADPKAVEEQLYFGVY